MFLGDQFHYLIFLLGSQVEFIDEIDQLVKLRWHDPGMFKVLVEVFVDVFFEKVHLLRCQHFSCIGCKFYPNARSLTDGITKPGSSGHESASVRDICVNLLAQTPCGIHEILDSRDDPGAPVESDLYKFDFLVACKS